MSHSALNLQIVLKGRPLQEYSFTQDVVRIGRDPQADVHLDNMGVSRDQARVVAAKDGWMIEDCGSANGTWLNRKKVERAMLHDCDEITIGKFTLRVGLESTKEVTSGGRRRAAASREIDGTTVLSRGQLASILEPDPEESAGQTAAPSLALAPPASRTSPAPLSRRLLLAAALLLAVTAGALAAVLLLR
jgi:pSer/pThr/pTyr-binding forkhead associated (FHA) protein